VNEPRKLLSSFGQQEKIEGLIEKSPSPALARTNVVRLIESAGLACWSSGRPRF